MFSLGAFSGKAFPPIFNSTMWFTLSVEFSVLFVGFLEISVNRE